MPKSAKIKWERLSQTLGGFGVHTKLNKEKCLRHISCDRYSKANIYYCNNQLILAQIFAPNGEAAFFLPESSLSAEPEIDTLICSVMGIVSVEARERMVELQVFNIIDEETLPKPVECQLLN
jgi:hypothetical protein